MKRMVLIPEERLLRYEQRDKENGERVMHGGGAGEKEEREEAVRGIPKSMKKGARVLLSRLKEKEDDSEEKREDSLTSEMIVRGIPKSMKTRAQALLEHLKEKEGAISWDSSGQVTLNGVFIPKSNISDLISDAMRPRKHFNPIGVQEFYKMLNEINIPKDLVRNEKRWSEVRQQKVKIKTPPGNSKGKKPRNKTKIKLSVKRKQKGGNWGWWKDGVKLSNQKGGTWISTEPRKNAVKLQKGGAWINTEPKRKRNQTGGFLMFSNRMFKDDINKALDSIKKVTNKM